MKETSCINSFDLRTQIQKIDDQDGKIIAIAPIVDSQITRYIIFWKEKSNEQKQTNTD